MKRLIYISLLLISCTAEAPKSDTAYIPVEVGYDDYRLAFQNEFDAFRMAQGLPILIPEKKLSELAQQHAVYMNATDSLSHIGFYGRCKESKAVRFGECVSYGYATAQSEISAYQESISHFNCIAGNYQYFGYAKVGNYSCLEVASWKFNN